MTLFIITQKIYGEVLYTQNRFNGSFILYIDYSSDMYMWKMDMASFYIRLSFLTDRRIWRHSFKNSYIGMLETPPINPVSIREIVIIY